MKKLEQVRLEVDSRRHTVSQLAQKIEKQRTKLTAVGDRAKSEENIETTIRRMQHKENKLAGAHRPATVQRCMCILCKVLACQCCVILTAWPRPEFDNNLWIVHAASRQSFKEQEALVYQQLAQLIRDGVWLKSYLAAVMRLQQEAYLVSLPAHAPSGRQGAAM